MKARFFLLLAMFLLSFQSIKAQYQYNPEPTSDMYDTIYLFDTTYITNCFLTNDSLKLYIYDSVISDVAVINQYPYSWIYSKFDWFSYSELKAEVCDSTIPVPRGYIVGANDYNGTQYAECFAQEYNLTNMPQDYVVCGVAIYLGSGALDDYRDICILNQSFDTLAKTTFHTLNIIDQFTEETWNWNRGGWNTYYFPYQYLDTLRGINNFKIAFDVPCSANGNWFSVIHTCNVYSPCIKQWIDDNGGYWETGYNYDSIRYGLLERYGGPFQHLRDTVNNSWYMWGGLWNLWTSQTYDSVIPLCSYPDPKFIKRNDKWIRFEEDPVYEIYRNIYIAMVPIIMVPKTQQSLTEAELSAVCYLYPNPTKSNFKVLSHYNIESVQVFDISGRLLKEQKLRYFEGQIDIGNLPSGTYIVKIHTSKGTAEKKLIKE